MKGIYILLILILVTGNAVAEIRTIHLSDAIDLAIKNNLSIAKSQKDIEIAEAQLGEAFADFAIPSIEGVAGFTEISPLLYEEGLINLDLPIPHAPIDISITNAYPDNYHAGVSVSKTLFAGFRLWNSMSIRKEYLELAKAKLRDIRDEVISTVTTSFYNLFLIKENIKSQEDYNQSLYDHVLFTSNNYVSGNATEFDFVTASLRYKLNIPKLTDLSNAYVNQKLSFCQQTGIHDPDSIEVVGDLLDTTNSDLPLTNRDEILALAFSNNINLMAIDTSIHVAKLSREIEQGSMYPTVGAFFDYSLDYNKTNDFSTVGRSWNNTWTTGVQMSMAFDSLIPFVSKTWNSVREAEKNVESLQIQRNILTNAITLDVQALMLQLEEGRQNIRVSQDDVSLSKLGFQLADDRYKAGTSTEIEVIDAENSEIEAEARFLKSILDYFSSNVKLKRMIGRLE
jgi:outer membrane protein